MLPATIADEYRYLRKRFPDTTALNAWRWAKGSLALVLHEWDANGERAEWEQDGFTVVVTMEPDYMDPWGYSLGTLHKDWKPGRYRYPPAWYLGEDWHGRPAMVMRREYGLGWYEPLGDTVEGMAEGWHQDGMAKGPARERAIEAMQEEIKRAAKLGDGQDWDIVMFLVKVYRKNVELGSASIGGYDFTYRPWRHDEHERWLREHDEALAETGIVDEAIAEAKATLQSLLPC